MTRVHGKTTRQPEVKGAEFTAVPEKTGGGAVMTCADPPLMTTTDAVTGHVEETQGRRGTKLYLSLWMRCLFSVPMFATS